ncbi:E3 ubiquitin ligase family protein, partial [Haloferax profundi]|uniref:E3 ubiquitin ligase family protein n=1 Tax=Haloferax profundi TaxID=1544718 RepID=UPI000A5E01FF
TGTETVPFYVDDGTGEVLVRPDAADLDLEWGTEIIVGRDERPPEPIEQFLSQKDDIDDPTEPVLETLWPNTGTRSFRERLIEAGDEVYVFGEANDRPSNEFGDNDIEIRQGVKGGHSEPRTFIVSDKPKPEVSGGHRSGGRLAVLIG